MAEKEQERPRGQTLDLKQAAALLDRSERFVQNLVQYGFVPREKRGEYLVVPLVHGAMKYMQEQIEKASKSAAASRATDARTREIELRIAERAKELIPLDDALRVVSEVVQMTRAEFAGLPARFTRDLTERRRLEQDIDGCFERLANKAGEFSAAVAAGELDMEASSENVSGGVGGEEQGLS